MKEHIINLYTETGVSVEKVCNNEVWRRMKTQAVINNIGLIKLDCIREVRIWY